MPGHILLEYITDAELKAMTDAGATLQPAIQHADKLSQQDYARLKGRINDTNGRSRLGLPPHMYLDLNYKFSPGNDEPSIFALFSRTTMLPGFLTKPNRQEKDHFEKYDNLDKKIDGQRHTQQEAGEAKLKMVFAAFGAAATRTIEIYYFREGASVKDINLCTDPTTVAPELAKLYKLTTQSENGAVAVAEAGIGKAAAAEPKLSPAQTHAAKVAGKAAAKAAEIAEKDSAKEAKAAADAARKAAWKTKPAAVATQKL